MKHARPAVVISRCIDFDACRYDGQVIRASLREELEAHVDLEPICPELEIGLGVPRDPIRLIGSNGEHRLVQPSTGRDLTDAMTSFSRRYLDGVGGVDGFILKSRSPSCGVRSAKVYGGSDEERSHGTGSGMFAAHVQDMFPLAAIEEEGRLNDLRNWDHFLTRLFAFAALRELAARPRVAALQDFHARNKLLLMAFNESRMRALGRIAAGRPALPRAKAFARYREELAAALARPARIGAHVNVLMHALGHVTDRLSKAERVQFIRTLDRYRAGRVPLSAPLAVVRSWAARFEVDYLAGQTYFEPYPEDLVHSEPTPRRRAPA